MKKILLSIITITLFNLGVNAQNWNEIIKATASDAGLNDLFGISVAISGDKAIVGAYGDSNFSGSAYIFEFNGTTWSQTAKLRASDDAVGDQFGESVSISGDKVIIGAARKDDAGNNSGSAYVFEFNGTIWSQTVKLAASDADAGDFFGLIVSISGDKAIVGASRNDDVGTASGSAYIFELSGGTWAETAKLTASDAASDDEFGISVSISGDKAIIGARDNDDNGSNSGSAYIFEFNGTTWSETTKLTASDADANDLFGQSVAISGDKAIVSAFRSDDAGQSSGSAYIFEFNGTTWSETIKLTASDAAADDLFGILVSISGDKAIVGAYENDDAGTNSGSAYIFEFNGTTWSETIKLTASDAAADDQFGNSVSIDGDKAIVGAFQNDDGGFGSGSAYILKKPISTNLITKNALSNNISIHPNPTSSQLTLNTIKKIEFISILDVTGKTIRTITPSSNTIDVSELVSGIYFLQVQTENGISNSKFIKK